MPIRKGLQPIECGLFEANDGSIWFTHPLVGWTPTPADAPATIYARLLRLAKRYGRKSFVFNQQRLEVW